MKGVHGPERAPTSAGGIAFNAALLALAVVLLAATSDLRASAAVVPRAVVVPLIALLAYRLVRDLMLLWRAESGARDEPRRTTDEVVAIVWLLALPAAATLVGFVAGPALWVATWAKFRAGERSAMAIGAGVVTAIGILVVFGGLLGARLPNGVFGG